MLDTLWDFLNFERYYGLDWAAAIFMFLSMHRLGNQHKDGFVFAALASLCWIVFNIIADSNAGILANAIIAAMAIRSLMIWNKTHQPTQPQE